MCWTPACASNRVFRTVDAAWSRDVHRFRGSQRGQRVDCRTCALSLTWQITRTGIDPRFLLTNYFCVETSLLAWLP